MNAVVLQLPAKVQRQARRRMNRVDLDARHSWMMENRDKWETEAKDGAITAKYVSPRVRQLMKLLDEKWGAIKGPTMTEMRRDIAEGRKLIEKRNRVKDWLESLGADLDEITTPEQALFLVFDRMHSRELPTSA